MTAGSAAALVGLAPNTGPQTAEALVDQVLDRETTAGPRVVAIMVASVDGQTAVGGRSGALGHPADQAIFRELRSRADAVLVGSATIAAEGYGNLIDPESRERRLARGQTDHPLVATISRALALPTASALFRTPGVPVLAFAADDAAAAAPGVAADLTVVRVSAEELTPQLVIDRLHATGGELIVCEGGSTLLDLLLAADLVDDLLLTVAPVWAGGDGQVPLSGPSPAGTRALHLARVARADDHLFLHYRLGAAGR